MDHPELMHRTGQVVRYSCNPEMIVFMQTDADHAWGVVTQLLLLHPAPSVQLLGAAQFHDSGELFAGDLPSPFKRANPEIAAAHEEIEFKLAKAAGVPQFELSKEDKQWLDFADRYESFLYMKLRKVKWDPQGIEQLYQQARDLGVADKIEGTLIYDF
jgi:5'-deoxynucleotidase YfbR-like HD superfamily hydrolase